MDGHRNNEAIVTLGEGEEADLANCTHTQQSQSPLKAAIVDAVDGVVIAAVARQFSFQSDRTLTYTLSTIQHTRPTLATAAADQFSAPLF